MAAMMLMLMCIVKLICIITAISWLPLLISELFHTGFLRLHHFHSLAVFVSIVIN